MKDKKHNLLNILFLQGVFIIYSFSIIVGKLASREPVMSLKFILIFMLEMFVFGIYAVLWQQIIKNMKLSTAYSAKGTVILWTMLLSKLIFNETIKPTNIIGALVILGGVYMVVQDE